MLVLENIHLAFNGKNGEDKEILRGISMEFQPGKMYAITGPNGGGKTSIAKIIMGIYQACDGTIYLNEENITQLDVTERARRGIVYAFQQPPRFKGLSVEDVLKIARPNISQFDLRTSLRDVGLCPEDYLDRDVGPGLSGGEMKRVEIAQVLARNAKISIFDEPEAGVDLWTIQKIIDIIERKYRDNPNITVIVITHNEKLLHICDEVVVVDNGLIQARGSVQEIWPLIRDEIECKMKNQCGRDVTNEL